LPLKASFPQALVSKAAELRFVGWLVPEGVSEMPLLGAEPGAQAEPGHIYTIPSQGSKLPCQEFNYSLWLRKKWQNKYLRRMKGVSSSLRNSKLSRMMSAGSLASDTPKPCVELFGRDGGWRNRQSTLIPCLLVFGDTAREC